MRTSFLTALAAGTILGMTALAPSFAQAEEAIANSAGVTAGIESRTQNRLDRRDAWKAMTPEQQAAKKAEMQAKWQEKYTNATPEQKARMDQMKAKREAWKNMTPEQRQAKRADMKAKYDALPPQQQQKIMNRMETRQNMRKANRAQ